MTDRTETQLTPAEAIEVFELTQDLAMAKWKLGWEQATARESYKQGDEVTKAQAESDRALLAVHDWLRAHSPKDSLDQREVRWGLDADGHPADEVTR